MVDGRSHLRKINLQEARLTLMIHTHKYEKKPFVSNGIISLFQGMLAKQGGMTICLGCVVSRRT
jgi:hypothetical protein